MNRITAMLQLAAPPTDAQAKKSFVRSVDLYRQQLKSESVDVPLTAAISTALAALGG